MESLSVLQPNAEKCRDVIYGLCKDYLYDDTLPFEQANQNDSAEETVDLNAQVMNLYQMMWSQDPTAQEGNALQEDAWMSFLDDTYDPQVP